MNTTTLKHSIALLMLCLASSYANADEQPVKLGFDAAAGFEYDSNVALQDLDTSSGESDSATNLEAGINMTIAAGQNASIRLGYDVAATAYQDFSDYDLTLHHLNVDLSRRGKHLDAAIAVDRFSGILAGDQYITFTQVSPNVSRLFGTRVFLRGAYIAAEKNYEELSSRNADKNALRLDTYWLFDGMDRFLSLGLEKSAEEAADPALDFDAAQMAVTYGHKIGLPLMELRLKAQVRYERRDYLNITQSIGKQRNDQRLRGSLSATIPFGEYVELEGNIEHTDNRSNLESARLDKLVFGLGLAIQF